MKNIVLIFIVIFSFLACSEQEIVIPEFEPPSSNKVILLEDLTGVKCPNCPAATSKAEELRSLYENKVIVVGVHGRSLTIPLAESNYDFRNDYAIEIENMLKPFIGKPAAGINRVVFEDVPDDEYAISDPDAWRTYIDREFEKPQQIELVIDTDYDLNSRELTVDARVIPLDDMSGEFFIGVMLLESNIIDPQKFPFETQYDYEHNHVLRTMLTSHLGDALTNTLTKAVPVDRSFSYTLPEDDGTWKPENMDVVVFVSEKDGQFYPVLQAGEVHIIE